MDMSTLKSWALPLNTSPVVIFYEADNLDGIMSAYVFLCALRRSAKLSHPDQEVVWSDMEGGGWRYSTGQFGGVSVDFIGIHSDLDMRRPALTSGALNDKIVYFLGFSPDAQLAHAIARDVTSMTIIQSAARSAEWRLDLISQWPELTGRIACFQEYEVGKCAAHLAVDYVMSCMLPEDQVLPANLLRAIDHVGDYLTHSLGRHQLPGSRDIITHLMCESVARANRMYWISRELDNLPSCAVMRDLGKAMRTAYEPLIRSIGKSAWSVPRATTIMNCPPLLAPDMASYVLRTNTAYSTALLWQDAKRIRTWTIAVDDNANIGDGRTAADILSAAQIVALLGGSGGTRTLATFHCRVYDVKANVDDICRAINNHLGIDTPTRHSRGRDSEHRGAPCKAGVVKTRVRTTTMIPDA